MGQKVHPNGIRLGVINDWNAKWYPDKNGYAATLAADLKIRDYITRKLANAALSRIVIDRPSQNLNITLYTARPGIVIGKKGEDIERLRLELAQMSGVGVQLAVEEIRKPELDAKLVAENICQQLEKRIMFRRAMKRAVQNSMRLGAEGVKVMLAGRLNGAEIARTEWYREGRVPLHTLRADIDYGMHEAHTTYGVIGVKVWIFKGEIYVPKSAAKKAAERAERAERAGRGPGGRISSDHENAVAAEAAGNAGGTVAAAGTVVVADTGDTVESAPTGMKGALKESLEDAAKAVKESAKDGAKKSAVKPAAASDAAGATAGAKPSQPSNPLPAASTDSPSAPAE
ncbi:MAG: 30S ribosomal protein S3 [Gammaproteobacteria bacterium]|nr:30S ribosomal protein S3 [Gammaproteobacteria bacterium]